MIDNFNALMDSGVNKLKSDLGVAVFVNNLENKAFEGECSEVIESRNKQFEKYQAVAIISTLFGTFINTVYRGISIQGDLSKEDSDRFSDIADAVFKLAKSDISSLSDNEMYTALVGIGYLRLKGSMDDTYGHLARSIYDIKHTVLTSAMHAEFGMGDRVDERLIKNLTKFTEVIVSLT